MYCSGCGLLLGAGQPVCPQCGRPVAPIAPTVPGFELQIASYAGKVRTLGILWLAFAGLSLALGFAGLQFAKTFMSGGFGPWMHGPMSPNWVFPAAFHFAWLFLVARAVLYAVAGWGLLERAEWGRILAIIVAILSLIKFPFGTALGIATLVILLGYRNTALYERL
jgi:hypothetical protein